MHSRVPSFANSKEEFRKAVSIEATNLKNSATHVREDRGRFSARSGIAQSRQVWDTDHANSPTFADALAACVFGFKVVLRHAV
jgi:hypothetical protein